MVAQSTPLADEADAGTVDQDAPRDTPTDQPEAPAEQAPRPQLSFRIAATPGDTQINLAACRERLAEQGPADASDDDDASAWVWRPIEDITGWLDSTDLTVNDFNALPDNQVINFFMGRGLVGQRHAGTTYLLLSNSDDGTLLPRHEGWAVVHAERGAGPDGFPSITFRFNHDGAIQLNAITRPNVQRPMAVLLDGCVLTAPNINEPLGPAVQLSGDFTPVQIDRLLSVLEPNAP